MCGHQAQGQKTATKSSPRKKLGETSETTKFSYACAGVPDLCTYTFFLQINFRDIFVSCEFFHGQSEFYGALHNFLKISKSPTIDMQFLLFGWKSSFPIIFRRHQIIDKGSGPLLLPTRVLQQHSNNQSTDNYVWKSGTMP